MSLTERVIDSVQKYLIFLSNSVEVSSSLIDVIIISRDSSK